MRNKKNKNDLILNELYRESFAASTPKGDWDKMLEDAELDEFGRKVIPYMDYYCPQEKLEEIFESVMKKYKVKSDMKKAFSFNFWLGCSPTSHLKTNQEC